MSQSVVVFVPSTDPVDDHAVACGLGFKREKIDWNAGPRIIGFQRNVNVPTDMAEQSGTYYLFSGKSLVHIGSTAHRNLGACLSAHTRDGFKSKWDNFNFFGLREVRSDGTLGEELTKIPTRRYICLQGAMAAFASPGCEYSKWMISQAKLIKFKQGLPK